MPKKRKIVNVTRSFSYKKNLGNFENVDFFCSQTAECYEDEVDKVSKSLYDFCKRQVVDSLNSYTSMEWEKREANFEKAYRNQPDLGIRKDTEENREFDRREALAHNWQDIKKGD